MDAKKVLDYLERLEREPGLMVNGNTYTVEQVLWAKKLTADIEFELGFRPSKPKLSRRRAFIVILEELFYDKPKYPDNLSLDAVGRIAVQRFEFAQRHLSSKTSPQDIHPKDACRHYENDGLKKMNYRRPLSHLVAYQELFFELMEAAKTLELKYREVLLCSKKVVYTILIIILFYVNN